MRFLRSIAGILAVVMFMLSAVSGLSFADDVVITDEVIDPETGLVFTLLENGTYSVGCPEINRDKLVGELVIPSEYNGVKVTEIAHDFRGFMFCNNITSVEISDGITEMDCSAFADCSSLKEIHIPKSVHHIIGNCFGNLKLENLYIDEDNEYYCSVDGVVFSKDKTSLILYPMGRPEEHYIIPNFVTTLSEDAFVFCDNLISVTMSENVIKIEDYAFSQCENLETINISASVREIGENAATCRNFKSMVVDEGNQTYCAVDGVLFSKDMTQLILYPFDKLDEVYTVPSGVISMVGIVNVHVNLLNIPKGVKRITSDLICSNIHPEIRYGGTLSEWKELSAGLENLLEFTIICSDGIIESEYPHIIEKNPVSYENEDNSIDFVAGVTKDVADTTNKLSSAQIKEIKEVINNISVNAPDASGFDTSVQLYVTPNIAVTQDFGSRCFSLDLTFKNSEGERIQPLNPVVVKIPVPERLKSSSPIYVYHIGDDGKAEKIKAVTETIDNIRYIVFGTDGFSAYVLTDTQVKDSNDTSDTSEPTSSDTSDPTSGSTSDPATSESSSGDTSEIDKPAVPDKPSFPSTSDKGQISKDVQTGENAPKTEIVTPNGTLMEAVLTADEQEQLKNGVDINVVLKVNEAGKTVSDTDKAIAEDVMRKAGYKSGLYLDLKLFKTKGGEEVQIDKTNEPITISFEIPKSLRSADRKYAVVRVHNGKADILNDYSDEENTVMIRTDKFSTYVLVYSEKSDAVNVVQPDNSNDNNPYTGDKSRAKIYFIVGIASLFVFIVLCLFTGKNGMTEEEKERKFSKIIAWGKKGGKVRAAVALTVIFLLLSFYYGIGMKTSEK